MAMGPSLSQAAGEGPVAIYRANKAKIVAEKLCRIKGYTFSLGVARPQSQSTAAKLAAMDKATLHAESRLVRPAFKQIDWPARLSQRQKDIFIRQYLNVAPLTIKISGKQRVDSGQREKDCFAVVAVPSHAVTWPRIDFPTIRQALDMAFAQRSSALNLTDYLEICPEEKIPPAVRSLADKFAGHYGPSVGRVLAGEPVSEPGILWQKGKRLPFNKIARLERDDLLRLLGLCPYDPVVLYALGKACEEAGFPRAGQLFYLRGTVWLLDDGYPEKCRDALRKGWFMTRMRIPCSEFTAMRKKVRARYRSTGPLQGKLADLVVQSMGTLPIRYSGPESSHLERLRDMLNSDSPNLVLARRLAETALDTAPSRALFALMARILERQGEPLLALPFRNQAGLLPESG